jgi:hypothetical protein
MKIPTYESNIAYNPQQLRTPPPQSAKDNIDMSNEWDEKAKLGQTIGHTAEKVFDYIEKKNERDQHFQVLEDTNKYTDELQNMLYNKDLSPTNQPIGLLNRENKDASGITSLFDANTDKLKNDYVNKAGSQYQKNLLNQMISAHTSQLRGSVISHEAVQTRNYQENIFKESNSKAVLNAGNITNSKQMEDAISLNQDTNNLYYRQLGITNPAIVDTENMKQADAMVKSTVGALLSRESNPLGGTNWGASKDIIEKVKDKISPLMYSELSKDIETKRFFDFQLNTWNWMKGDPTLKSGDQTKHAGIDMDKVKERVFSIKNMDELPLDTYHREKLWDYIRQQIAEEQSVNTQTLENLNRSALNTIAKMQAEHAKNPTLYPLSQVNEFINNGTIPSRDEVHKNSLRKDASDTYLKTMHNGDDFTMDDLITSVLNNDPNVVYKIDEARVQDIISVDNKKELLRLNKEKNENPDVKSALDEAKVLVKDKYGDKIEQSNFMQVLVKRSHGMTGDQIRVLTKELLGPGNSKDWLAKIFGDKKWEKEIKVIESESADIGMMENSIGKYMFDSLKLGKAQGATGNQQVTFGWDDIKQFSDAFDIRTPNDAGPDSMVYKATKFLRQNGQRVTVPNLKKVLKVWKGQQ